MLEERTQAECQISASDIAMYDFDFVTDLVAREGKLVAAIAEINEDELSIRLSMLEILDPVLESLSKIELPTHGTAIVCRIDDLRRFWLRLEMSGSSQWHVRNRYQPASLRTPTVTFPTRS